MYRVEYVARHSNITDRTQTYDTWWYEKPSDLDMEMFWSANIQPNLRLGYFPDGVNVREYPDGV